MPRLPSGACSARKVMAPAASPPTEKPWRRRQEHQQAGRRDADGRVVGSRPMPAVATLISRMTKTSSFWRPIRSPRYAADDGAEGTDEEGHGVARRRRTAGRCPGSRCQEHEGQGSGHEGEDAVVVELDEDADAPGGHYLAGLPRIEAVVLRDGRAR